MIKNTKDFREYLKKADAGDLNIFEEKYNSIKKIKEFGDGIKYLKLVAKQNDKVAQYYLGFYSETKSEARKWYKLSAKQGHIEAQFQLGSLYEFTRPKLFFYWNKLAADQNHTIAPLIVGICFLNGYGTKQNFKHAVKYFKKIPFLTEMFGGQAQYYLGYCYEKGLGVKKNIKLAIENYKNVIVNNDSVVDEEALENLALIYMKIGKFYNPKLAFKLLKKLEFKVLKKVSNWSYESCYNHLGYCYINGIGIKKNIPQAIKYFMKNSKTSSYAMSSLGHIYKYIKKYENFNYALKWYKLAYENGDNESILEVINIYENLGKNKEAFEWLKFGADNRNEYCQKDLGVYYLNGEFIKQDIPNGIKWLEIARKNSNTKEQAAEELGKLYEYGPKKYQNHKKALSLYKQAAENLSPIVTIKLAYIYFLGKWVRKNDKKTFELLSLIHKQANYEWAEISWLLSLCFYHGIGTKKDEKEALKLIKLAINQGIESDYYNNEFQGTTFLSPYRSNFKFACDKFLMNYFI